MITTPSSLADQILNLAEGVGAELKAIKDEILYNIDGGLITEDLDTTSAGSITTQLQALVGTASALKEELESLGASTTISDINARLTAIENVDYNSYKD